MWYFTWILGLGLACSVGIINAMWIEYQMTGSESKDGSLSKRGQNES